MDRCIREEGDDLQRLRVVKPEKAHDNDNGMVEHMQEGEGPSFQEHDEGVKEFIVLTEVEDVRPEEDSASSGGTGWETEEPLPCSCG